jgi:deoxyribose-phosphate aldolase
MTPTLSSIAKMIDHSLLHPTLTDTELLEGCRLARKHDVASVCIKPYAVPLAVEALAESTVAVGTVVGFPHGNSCIDIKLREAEHALADGATELDMVVNIGKVLSNDWKYVANEVGLLNETTVSHGGILKVIFENDFLGNSDLKKRLCQICNSHLVAFAKTSTGYGFVKRPNGMYSYEGATDHDIALMRTVCNSSIQIKAAGGIRTLNDVLRVAALGVTRIGATTTAAILEEAKGRGFAP